MDNTEQFANELTELSRKYGLGINGGVLFEMESDDAERNYKISPESELIFE